IPEPLDGLVIVAYEELSGLWVDLDSLYQVQILLLGETCRVGTAPIHHSVGAPQPDSALHPQSDPSVGLTREEMIPSRRGGVRTREHAGPTHVSPGSPAHCVPCSNR